MAQALEAIGIRPGDRVATLAMNHAAHLTAWYGAIGMGGVLHTINPRLFDDQLAFIANHAEDRVLLYDRAFKPIVERLKPRWTTIEHYICFEDEFEAWLAPHDGDYAWHEGDERDPCGLCYTSGTTGDPKGVLYEHRSAMLHALAEVAPDCFNLSARSVVLPIVPMFHANAWGIPWAAPLTGCKLVLSADYRPAQMCDLFRDEKVSHSAGVPTIWLGMIEHIEATGANLADLKYVTIGGSAAPRAMISWFRDRGVEVGHAWGMTETSPIGTMGAPPADWDSMSDARAARLHLAPGPRAVRDRAARGRRGRRGPAARRRPAAATSRCAGRGWSSATSRKITTPPTPTTGSIPATSRCFTPAGRCRSPTARRTSSSRAANGSARSTSKMPRSAAPGWPRRRRSASPIPSGTSGRLLAVVRAPGSDVGEEAIRAHLATQVAKWWLPDAIEFVPELPHTATGKLSKKTLREQFRDYRFAGAEDMVGRD